MRKTSKILGIIGGSLSAVIALFMIFGGVFLAEFLTNISSASFYEKTIEYAEHEGDFNAHYDGEDIDEAVWFASSFLKAASIGIGIVFLIFAVIGIVAGAIVEKSNVAGGIMMIVCGIISLLSAIGLLSAILLILGGIFAFARENETPKEPQQA